ncbi:hypothetical protein [Burkholderia sp. BCC1630]|nr:hypothetical protein [Burkholderia sp. BCC1630]
MTIDDARAAAIASLDAKSDAQWSAVFTPARKTQARSAPVTKRC